MVILFENHNSRRYEFKQPDAKCECSYCRKLHYGLNKPKMKSPTSWYVIKFPRKRYIRFTLPKFLFKD